MATESEDSNAPFPQEEEDEEALDREDPCQSCCAAVACSDAPSVVARHAKLVENETKHLSDLLLQVKSHVHQAKQQVQDISFDSSRLLLRVEQLQKDEDAVKKAEHEALLEKIISQKKLVDIGGHESAMRSLVREIAVAQSDLEKTNEEQNQVASEQKRLDEEVSNLSALLAKHVRNSQQLQQEHANLLQTKKNLDDRFSQLALLLRTSTILPDKLLMTSSSAST